MDLDRRAIAGSALLGGVLTAVAILAFSGGSVWRMTLSDGLIARYVASHLATPSEEVHPVVSTRGTSLRYGRIGLPLAIWIASGGWPPAMPYVQPVIMVLSGGAIAAAARALFPRAPPLLTLSPFLALGVFLGVVGGFADGLGAALALWSVAFAMRERWWAAAGMLAAALLARENAGSVLVGLAVWFGLRRRWKPVAIMMTSLIPLLGWYAFVAARYGHIPAFDPYLRVQTSTIRPPLIAVWQSLTMTSGESLIIAAIHVGLAVLAFALWRRSLLGMIAAATALQVLMAGPFSWKFIGEAARTFTFLQLFLVLALLPKRWIQSEKSDHPCS